ncbi:MAG TPA: hypothetical protein VG206_24710 [Terriglobia bacterium]|nr:hypothetical protein [Terriglobia bacterium]
MYVFFEDVAVVALTALMATLVFVASVVVVTVGRGIGAVLRISRKTASAGTPEELLSS